jgi:CMP-N-acetylneuraminic acid synthetase
MEDAAKNFPKARLLERPENLRAGTIPMNDVLLNTIDQIESDFYLQTHSTNPLVTPKTITEAVQSFLDNYPLFDSLFSVTRLQATLWDGLTRAVNHNPAILLRRQDLPPIYEENSCFYIFTRGTMESRHNRIGHRPLMFEMDRVESVDIDEEFDFQVAEFLYQAQKS